MTREITIAKFKDVANGLQPGQFSIGEREKVSGLDGLDPIYEGTPVNANVDSDYQGIVSPCWPGIRSA